MYNDNYNGNLTVRMPPQANIDEIPYVLPSLAFKTCSSVNVPTVKTKLVLGIPQQNTRTLR